MSDASKRGRIVCYTIIALAVAALCWLEFGKPVLSDDEVLQPMISMTLTRQIGAAVFLAILIYNGYRVLDPFRKPFGKSILFSLPAFLVVVNNLPFIPFFRGQVTLIHTAPVYWIWFSLESLSIGLFEELAFRGVILLMFAERRHRTRKDLFICILLTSAVFGVVHLFNVLAGSGIVPVLQQIAYSFLIGAMCSVVLYKTANIWLCVLLHALFDFCGEVFHTLGICPGWWDDLPTVILTFVIAAAVGAYMVIAVWRMDPHELDRIYEK
ncbi:MAG: CPBP family intramembrane metalloprotease [Clostridia bacterium]|nr:CPBP family intramembrane metalloprotease [Clostridia bacterium]